MRKVLLALAVLSVMSFAAPSAQATVVKEKSFTAGPAVPCAVACAYWDGPSAAGFSPCEYPFPEGSYVDVVTEAAPPLPSGTKFMALEISISPLVDWDSYICSTGAPGFQKQLAQGTNILGQNCDSPFGGNQPVPLGCIETASTLVKSGQQYIIRLYNWSDPATVPGKYRFTAV